MEPYGNEHCAQWARGRSQHPVFVEALSRKAPEFSSSTAGNGFRNPRVMCCFCTAVTPTLLTLVSWCGPLQPSLLVTIRCTDERSLGGIDAHYYLMQRPCVGISVCCSAADSVLSDVSSCTLQHFWLGVYHQHTSHSVSTTAATTQESCHRVTSRCHWQHQLDNAKCHPHKY